MKELVTVVFGGPSPEHDISILTGLQVERVLTRAGVQTQCLYWDRAGRWHLVPDATEARDYLDGAPKGATKVDVSVSGGDDSGIYRKAGLGRKKLDLGTVLLALHGGPGEGGGTQSMFRTMGVPCTGSSLEAAALGMDKAAFGALIEQAGLPALRREVLDPDLPVSFEGPYIVKPRYGGSSIGITVVDDVDTALALLRSNVHLRAGAVIEPFRSDLWDLNVAFTTSPEFTTSLIERPLRSDSNEIYDYAGKYMGGEGMASAPRELPAQISDELAARVREYALKVAKLTGLEGVCRVDFLTDGEQVFINEVNSIPGAMGLYLFPETDPAGLLLGMVAEAKSFARRVPTTVFEAGAALRAAGGIAGKLTGLGPTR